jgi:hypothetical protein
LTTHLYNAIIKADRATIITILAPGFLATQSNRHLGMGKAVTLFLLNAFINAVRALTNLVSSFNISIAPPPLWEGGQEPPDHCLIRKFHNNLFFDKKQEIFFLLLRILTGNPSLHFAEGGILGGD